MPWGLLWGGQLPSGCHFCESHLIYDLLTLSFLPSPTPLTDKPGILLSSSSGCAEGKEVFGPGSGLSPLAPVLIPIQSALSLLRAWPEGHVYTSGEPIGS